MIHTHANWKNRIDHELSSESLIALMENQIPFLRIPNFASHDECENIVANAISEGFGKYRNVEPKINRIGNTVFEYENISKEEYFADNEEITKVQDRIFNGGFNPVTRLINLLHRETDHSVNVAKNVTDQKYYAGLIRRIEDGTLIHVDFASQEQPDWEIGQVTHQLSWNLYIRIDGNGSGATHIFNRQWADGDLEHKQGSYGYHPIVVEGADETAFLPNVGEVIIFNTRNFHFVDPTIGERVSVTSAIGRMPGKKLVLWS